MNKIRAFYTFINVPHFASPDSKRPISHSSSVKTCKCWLNCLEKTSKCVDGCSKKKYNCHKLPSSSGCAIILSAGCSYPFQLAGPAHSLWPTSVITWAAVLIGQCAHQPTLWHPSSAICTFYCIPGMSPSSTHKKQSQLLLGWPTESVDD